MPAPSPSPTPLAPLPTPSADWLNLEAGGEQSLFRTSELLPDQTRFGPKGKSAPPPLPAIPGFRMLRELGRGGMGIVYLAEHELLRRTVALKMILAGRFARPEERLRFAFEAELAARIHHPNVVQVFEVGAHEGRPFFVSEHVEGGTLAERLRLPGEALTPHAAAELIAKLAQGLEAAHAAGVIHRDLKPANVLLSAEREGRSEELAAGANAPSLRTSHSELRIPKIADFGLAKALDRPMAALTDTGATLGTPSYMAPEQAQGRPDVGPAADIYALGVILYECLTGAPPFHGASSYDTLQRVVNEEPIPPRRQAPSVPADLEVICLKCLAKQPERRYRSAGALAADLERFQQDRPILARPAGAAERAWRWGRRNRALAAALATLALLAIGSFASLAGLYFKAERQREQADLARKQADAQRQKATAALLRSMQVLDDMTGSDEGMATLAERPEPTAGQKRLLTRAAEHYADFAREFQDDPEHLEAVAVGLSRLGIVQHDLGQNAEAAKTFTEAVRLHRELVKANPAKPQAWQRLGSTLHNLALTELANQALPRGEALLREAAAAQRKALALDPKLLSASESLGADLERLARCVAMQGRGDEGLRRMKEALAVRKEAVLLFPDREQSRLQLGRTQISFATLLLRGGNLTQAQAVCHDARAELADQMKKRPDDLTAQRLLAEAWIGEARILEAQSQSAAAAECWRAALPLCEGLSAAQPGLFDARDRLADIHDSLGMLLDNAGQHEQAARSYLHAIAVREAMLPRFSENSQVAVKLAGTRCNLGIALEQQGKAEPALAAFSQAETELRELLKRKPEPRAARGYYWNSVNARAQTLEKAGRTAEAASVLAAAFPEFGGREREGLVLKLALYAAKAGDEAKARSWLARLDGGPAGNAHAAYRSGCVISALAALAAESGVQRLLEAEALGHLRTALRMGLKRPDHALLVGELRPLRGRAEFNDLLWSAAEAR